MNVGEGVNNSAGGDNMLKRKVELTRIRDPVLQFHTNSLSSSITCSPCPDSRNKTATVVWLMDIYGG